jgi:hypothetical protein
MKSNFLFSNCLAYSWRIYNNNKNNSFTYTSKYLEFMNVVLFLQSNCDVINEQLKTYFLLSSFLFDPLNTFTSKLNSFVIRKNERLKIPKFIVTEKVSLAFFYVLQHLVGTLLCISANNILQGNIQCKFFIWLVCYSNWI